MDPNILDVMEDEGSRLLVFLAADFTVFDVAGNNPSTEIVVRHREPPWCGVPTPCHGSSSACALESIKIRPPRRDRMMSPPILS